MLQTHKNFDVLHYDSSNLHFYINENENSESVFDSALKRKWQNAEKNGIFRYTLCIKDWKVLEGEYKFLVQFNIDRQCNRRKPESILCMSQLFDSMRFNFTKLSKEEILLSIQNNNENDVIAINASPLEQCHCLLLIDRLKCLPQCVTERSLCKAVELLLLSESQYIRICFNSLCAKASVNHLHWHLYYLKHKMLLEHISVEHFVGPVYLLVNYPSKGFCLKLSSSQDIKGFIFWSFVIVNYLQKEEIAHNIYITRAKTNVNNTQYDDIRMYIWARKSCTNNLETDLFKPAACELFGHLSIGNEAVYQNLTEDAVATVLSNTISDVFDLVKENVKQLIKGELEKYNDTNKTYSTVNK